LAPNDCIAPISPVAAPAPRGKEKHDRPFVRLIDSIVGAMVRDPRVADRTDIELPLPTSRTHSDHGDRCARTNQ